MPNALLSPSHGAAQLFTRKKRPFLPLPAAAPSPAVAEPAHSPARAAATTTTTTTSPQHAEPDSPRPSTASHADLSLSPLAHSLTEPSPARSSSIRSPKGRSVYAQFGEAFAARWEARASTGSSARYFPPSAFTHRSRASESATDLYAKDSSASTSRNPSFDKSPTSAIASGPASPLSSRRLSNSRLPATAFSSGNSEGYGITRSMTVGYGGVGGGQNSAHALFQHIQNVASKRMSTLEYLRQVHQGNVHWFTTLQFQRSDFSKLPYFEPRKLARRATNYLLLGISLPSILDPNSDTATEYLRAFNALLGEFETYQNLHSVDGTPSSSISKSRIPQLFRRATGQAGAKSRRTSNPAEFNGYDPSDPRSGGSYGSTGSASFSSITSDHELLPGEEYNFLLTPSLPFEPDYFETFVTLCDVLIDCYSRITTLINGPEAIQPGVGDLFSKADAKVRKLLIASLVQEFGEASKQGIKAELAGVGKVVLGPLLG